MLTASARQICPRSRLNVIALRSMRIPAWGANSRSKNWTHFLTAASVMAGMATSSFPTPLGNMPGTGSSEAISCDIGHRGKGGEYRNHMTKPGYAFMGLTSLTALSRYWVQRNNQLRFGMAWAITRTPMAVVSNVRLPTPSSLIRCRRGLDGRPKSRCSNRIDQRDRHDLPLTKGRPLPVRPYP